MIVIRMRFWLGCLCVRKINCRWFCAIIDYEVKSNQIVSARNVFNNIQMKGMVF